MKIVCDASTLILLAKIELLRELTDEFKLVIPERVKKECLAKEGTDAKLIETLIKEKKIEVRVSGNQELVRKIQRDFRIEAGEAEALCLARTLNCVIAVDDGPTIKACRVLGQKFATAIHFLLNMASRNKLDVHVAEVKLEQLARFGRYSKRILEDASERLKGGKKWA
ncbi:MAG: hypothetical protein AABY50_00745 [Nitrospirota bacterium]